MTTLIYIFIGFALSLVAMRMVNVAPEDRTRWIGIWCLLTAAAFFGRHFMLFALIVAIASALLAQGMRQRIAVLFVVLLPLIPAFSYYIPGFLGINYLLLATYPHVLIAVLLLPAFLAYRHSLRPKLSSRTSVAPLPAFRNGLDFFFFGFCMWQILGTFIHMLSVTDALRSAIEILLLGLLPYLAVSRLIQTREQLRDVLTAVMFTGILQFGVCLVEALAVGRSPYLELPYRLGMNPVPGLTFITQYRFGLPRVRGTIDGGVGVLLVAAMSGFLCFAQLTKMTRFKVMMGVAFLAIPIVLTGSRAIWIMAVMMLMLRMGFKYIRTPTRFVVVVIAALFAIPYAQEFLVAKDQFGTFDYRSRLMETFFPVVFEKPIFGWGGLTELFSTGRFNYMLQGEGIIDMVNTFLGVGLQLGVTGALLFSGIFLASVLILLRRLQTATPAVQQQYEPYVVWICSIVPPLAFLLSTTSLVGHTLQYLTLIAAISCALCTLLMSEERVTRLTALQRSSVSGNSMGDASASAERI